MPSLNNVVRAACCLACMLLLNACASDPLEPYVENSPPLVLVPVAQAGVQDKRGRFREIFCAILDERREQIPDYLACDQALTLVGAKTATDVGSEPGATGAAVPLQQGTRKLMAVVVPGVGWDCFANWLDLKPSAQQHLRQFGYDQALIPVDSLAGTAINARIIRDWIVKKSAEDTTSQLVLIGYSKGAPDILQALVSYPEIRTRVVAVVSAAGAIGGSPLANDAEQSQLDLLRHWPGAECGKDEDTEGAVKSLRPEVRKQWLANNPIPAGPAYYSLVTYPRPERISSVLEPAHSKLSRIDGRNDGQVLFYDQVIPGSTLLGYVNADHWALAVPIARTHTTLGSTFVDQNHYPREALLEALLRFIEEDLDRSGKPPGTAIK